CELIRVETSRGPVQGFDHDFGNDTSKRFFGYGQLFLGIPYAKAPLGERRFTLPEDICKYNDRGEVHNATYYRPRCWHTLDLLTPADAMDEDCLYLNVMTPNISRKYPVMVYIHGGAFTTGGADIQHWKGAVRNLVSRGVVVVTIQYRLGLIGFFTTFTETFPPNRGLYDQILGLRWVKEEIANFGGDSNRITIFGQSAGATSVSDLSLSPLARGLFHQLIQMSGSALQQIETIDDPRGSVHQARAEQKGRKVWNPVIDGAVLPDYPENLAKSRPKYPALIGDVQDDFALFIPGVMMGHISNISRDSIKRFVQGAGTILDEDTAKNISTMMINGYSKGAPPADSDHLGWAKLMSDMRNGLQSHKLLIQFLVCRHRKAGNEDVWLFTFAHRSLLSFNLEVDGWMPIAHCSELPYLWFYPNKWDTYNASDADLIVADNMGMLWTDFAKNGKISFPRVENAMNYVEIKEKISHKTKWRLEANKVFNEQIPEYLGVEYPPLKMSDES
ncbi:hypothetical protein PENTCL1PPCAC_8426, partial [Pristionchus entomophagus]